MRSFTHTRAAAIAAMAAAAMLFPAGAACAAKPERLVSVVYGETSLVSKTDANYAFSRARSVSRMLAETGIESAMFSDRKLAAAFAPPCKLAHLVYMESPTREHVEAVRKFVSAGGKVIVHYSTSPAFSKLMGTTAPEVVLADKDQWIGYTLPESRPLYAPKAIWYAGYKIWQVKPAAKTTSVLARWVDASGKPGPVAILKTSHGFWITRIMLETDDADARRQLMASLSASCVPEIWRLAAKKMDSAIWAKVGAKSLDDAKRHFRKTVRKSKANALERRLDQLDRLNAAKADDFMKGLYGASMGKLWKMEKAAMLAYAAAMPEPASHGITAVWIRSPAGIYPGDWRKTAAVLSRAGVTDVYLMTAELGFGHVPIPGVVQSISLRTQGNMVAEAVMACHARGIRVHAWIPALSIESMPDENRNKFIKDGRAMSNARGGVVKWANPGDRQNREELANIAVWIANNTGMDGIHLDYIRYPHEECMTGPRDRTAFERYAGAKAAAWPADVAVNGKMRKKFEAWRAMQLNGMVSYVSERIRKEARGTAFSVAVYGKYPQCIASVGQDWGMWVKKGWVDYAIPMNYTGDVGVLKKLIDDQVDIIGKAKLVAGIGVNSFEATLNAKETLDQIQAAAEFRVKGVAFYHFDRRFADEIAPALELAR